jgi:hypothetical protein
MEVSQGTEVQAAINTPGIGRIDRPNRQPFGAGLEGGIHSIDPGSVALLLVFVGAATPSPIGEFVIIDGGDQGQGGMHGLQIRIAMVLIIATAVIC